MVGLARQLSEVALDGAAGFLAVGGEDRLAVLFGDLPRDVLPSTRSSRSGRPAGSSPTRIRRGWIPGIWCRRRRPGSPGSLPLLAAAPGHGQLLGVAIPVAMAILLKIVRVNQGGLR